MPIDGPSRDPRTQPAGRDRGRRGRRRPRCRARRRSSPPASPRSAPAIAAIFLADPDRPGLTLAASRGRRADAQRRSTADAQDPGNPFAEAAAVRAPLVRSGGHGRVRRVDPWAPTCRCSSRAAGSRPSLGSIGMAWPAPHELPTRTASAAQRAGRRWPRWRVDRARLASTASERSEWFERMAHTDPLTGLANERTVGRILELELARAGRQGSEVSLAMFDVDDFRATNEQGGHVAGDEVLRQVAAVLAESVRLVDTVGRIGGDEFVLVAPGVGRRDGRPAGARRDRRAPRGGRADRVGVGGRRPLPGRRHRFRVADRGRDRGADAGQGRGRRFGGRERGRPGGLRCRRLWVLLGIVAARPSRVAPSTRTPIRCPPGRVDSRTRSRSGEPSAVVVYLEPSRATGSSSSANRSGSAAAGYATVAAGRAGDGTA